MDVEAINQQLAALYGATDWVVVADVAAGTLSDVDTLRGWGVRRIMVIAATEGVGPLPASDVIHYTRSHSPSMMGGFRAFARSLRAEEVRNAIASFESSSELRILAPPFGAEGAFDRRAYGERRAEWVAFEDKMIVDRFFADAGVATAPSAVVAVEEASEAGRRVAGDLGSVWVADNTEGWHGGGEYVRWVESAHDEISATAWFGEHSRRVRVMPFLEGIPCSIHGFVTGPGDVAVFRPVEMLIARDPHARAFRYLGMSTTWDPPATMREEMRSVARRVAHHLDETVRYRGPFSVDGVATASGFLPTELNPRMSSGFGIQAGTVPALRIGLLTRAVVENDVAISAADLEALVVQEADAHRVIRAMVHSVETRGPESIPVRIDGDVIHLGGDDQDGTIDVGPGAGGSVAMLKVDPERLPVGTSAAHIAVAAAQVASRTWDLRVPELVPAVPVPFVGPNG